MNSLVTLWTIFMLFISKSYSFPYDITTDYMIAELETTIETTTTTTVTTTTTTTTLAPEVDREWEDLVLAGPTVVNYLGLFMVLASHKDQALTPPDGYNVTYLPNIQSLRSILTWISAEMQAAFKMASADLIRTRSSMDQIPDHIKAGLVLIQTAPNDLLSKLLPYTLRNVDRAANEGSVVTKPTLERFVLLGLWFEELVTLLGSTLSSETVKDLDYLTEANAYATDIKAQWDLLVKLFQKFSERADLTQRSVINNFIDPTNQVQKDKSFETEKQRSDHLNKLIPASIFIDQSSYLLDMMARTYSDISQDHMAAQITTSNNYLGLGDATARATSQRQLWQNTIAQSVKVARLAQERQNQFAETSSGRHTEYSTYSKSAIPA